MSNSAKHMTAFLAALLCCGPVSVLADPTSDQLTKIEAETLLLKARERQLDVRASILSKQNEIAAKQNMGNQLTQGAAVGDPLVRGIEGIGSTVFATLQLVDGSVIDVQAGDVLSNGMQVVSIAPGNVIVRKGQKRIRLASYAPRPAAFNPNLPVSGLRLPLPGALPRGGMR